MRERECEIGNQDEMGTNGMVWGERGERKSRSSSIDRESFMPHHIHSPSDDAHWAPLKNWTLTILITKSKQPNQKGLLATLV